MRGFTERLVGNYGEVWSDEMWNDFMPEDTEATNQQAASSSSTAEARNPYIPPDVFKVGLVADPPMIAEKARPSVRPKSAPSPL